MKENEKFLKESIDLLNRDFGQPLPTISSVMEKHQENLKEDDTILETPSAIAAAAASAVLHSPKGRDVKVSTALKNKKHPLHKRALDWVKSKMKKKDEPKKQSKSDSDFYRKQYEDINSSGYSQLKKPLHGAALAIQILNRALKQQHDDKVVSEIEYLYEKAEEMLKIVNNKKYTI